MSIYDDLANSDFVNPGEFKAQMKAMSRIEDTDGPGGNRRGVDGDPPASGKEDPGVQLPGPRYELPVDDEDRVGNSSEEFKMRLRALESVKRQNMMKEYNPMDDENEQTLEQSRPMRGCQRQDEGALGGAREPVDEATGRVASDQYQAPQRDGQDEAQDLDHNPQLKEFRFEQLQKQASEERTRFQMQTKERQHIPENDFLEQEDGGRQGREEEAETPYDLLVKKRNQMIFDDNIQLSERQQQEAHGAATGASEPLSHPYGLQAQDDQQDYGITEKLPEAKAGHADNAGQFTLNQYDSRSDLRKKVPESAEEFDSQVQTAYFKKQGAAATSGKDGASNSEYVRTNTEQTQRTRAGEQSAPAKADPKQGHLIDQRGIQASSQFQDGQHDDYQDSAQRKRNMVSKYAHILEAQHDPKDRENEDTGQFGGKAARWNNPESNADPRLRQPKNVHVDQFKADDLGDSKLGSSPTIRNKGDNESDKINQLLAQLQAPMTMDHLDSSQQQRQMGITETSSQREDYNMNQLELERAHRQMQQSIKQMKLITQGAPSSVDQFSAAQDDQGSVNGQKFGAFGFNGQNSIYELANKVGHQLSSSNLQSITHTDNDNEFQKMLQGEGQSLGSGRYQMIDQKLKGAGDPERDSGAYPGTMTDTTGMINLACSDKPSQAHAAAPQSTNSNPHFDQLKLLMQRHSDKSNPDENAATGHRNNENFNGKNIPFEHDAHGMRNRPSNLRSESQFVHMPLEQPKPLDLASEAAVQQQPPIQKQMSLAQRANQAKMAAQRQQELLGQRRDVNFEAPGRAGHLVDFSQPPQNAPDQYNQNYRKRFDPAALNQHHQYSQMEMMGPQYPQQQMYGQPPMQFGNYHYQHPRTANEPPENPVADFSKTDRNSKVEKRKALMAQFDDIPIHQLHKADGYQIRNIDDESEDGLRSRPGQRSDHAEGHERGQPDDELQNVSLKDQAFHPKWKVRLNAFKEINQLFVDYQGPSRALQKEDEMYGDPDNPFELYGPIIQEMIKDNNLTARYEGLNCLFSFVKYGSEIRSVSNSCLAFLLDKIQLNKPNFRDITQRVLLMMMHKKQHILPEVLKRFTSKTQIQLSFCISLVNQAFQERTLQVQDSNMKLVFKYTHDLLGHQNKEIRDQSLQLITFVYMNCEDDLNAFCANVRTLRPVQLKELRETLAGVEKSKEGEFLVRLFDRVSALEGKRDGNAPGGHGDRSPHGRSKSLGSEKGNQHLGGEDQDGDEPNGQQEVDLLSLLPPNFNEIPYITQINIKRKALEQFNQELEKLWKKQEAAIEQHRAESEQNEDEDDYPCLVRLNKDYSQIYNIITHMLEDANLLVFIEAIRSVELLAYLLSSSMKQIKAKNFLLLLADKYKEVKTAVLTQLEKTFDALFDNRCLSPQMFFDTLLNQIAAAHKNPRVRQMVLDRVEIIVEKNYLSPATGESRHTPQLFATFKQVKDKLKQIVLKDTNAQVRDAGVSLVGLFKIILQGADCDLLVSEVISALPKQRQTQIQQRVEMFQQQRQEGARDGNPGGPPISARFFATGDDQSRQTRSRSRGRSGRSAARGKSAKSTEKYRKTRHSDASQNEEGHSPHGKPAAGTDQVFLFQTKKAQSNVSSKFQATLSDVILTIKNIGQENDRLRTTQIIDNLDQALNELAEGEGINECKCPIVTCIFWLFTNYPQKVDFLESERQEAIKALLNFLKKLYCYDRSVSKAPATADGHSVELYQAASSLVICYALLHRDNTSHKTVSQILNVLMIAASESGLAITSFLSILRQVFTKYDPCPRLIGNGRAIIASHTIYFVADKMSEMVLRAQSLQQEISLADFEDFRSTTIQQLESPSQSSGQAQPRFSEQDKALLVQALVYFQEKMSAMQRKMDPGANDLGNESIDQLKASSQEGLTSDRSHLQSTSQFAGQVADPTPAEKIPRHLEVIEEITADFEKGLLKLKQLVGDEQSGRVAPTTFEQKEQIVSLLIRITTQGYRSPAEQYKQAYSLKALMWLKEEFIGLQETFQLTFSVMNPYTFARFEERDHSIEKYLLDFWTKDLSLRDCIDRIQYTCTISMVDSESTFFFLFEWLLEKRIFSGAQEDTAAWEIEDFRKIAPKIASILVKGGGSEERRVRATTILKFIDVCVDRYGAKKFRDFIEIQLIHDNETCLKFLDIFNEKYHNELPKEREKDATEGYLVIHNDNINPPGNQANRNHTVAAVRETTNTDSKESLGEPYLSAQSATGANPSLQQSFNQVTDRSQLLQEMRDRRKISALNAKTTEDELEFQDTLAREKEKYEEIMKKLENYKSASRQTSSRSGTADAASNQVPDGQRPVTTDPAADGNRFDIVENRQSSTAKHKDEDVGGARKMNEGAQRTGSARYSNRYEHHLGQPKMTTNQDGSTSLQDFNDEEDFKLSADHQQSVAQLGAANALSQRSLTLLRPGAEGEKFMDDRLKMQQLGHRSSKTSVTLGEGLKSNLNNDKQHEHNKSTIEVNESALEGQQTVNHQQLQESRQKIRESVQFQEEKLQRLESSQIKVRQFKVELETLNEEKRKLEIEKQQLLSEQNRETEEWKLRFREMTAKNDEITSNLAEANQQYLRQVSDNERLTNQILLLQDEHKSFLERYKQLEQKLIDSENLVEEQKIKLLEESQKANDPSQSPGLKDSESRGPINDSQIIEEQSLTKIAKVFDQSEMMQYGQDNLGAIGVKKIQELLLDSEGATQRNLAKSMIFHYQKMKNKLDRMQMLSALKQSLDNEDILFAISVDTYKSLLNFLLQVFSFEKELIERESLDPQHERQSQNELTQESQRLVSKLLNSKEFTHSLICLIQLLKNDAMPADFSANLSIQQRHYLRVIMRCTSRITKALHSENPDLIRAFDVLIEMHKLFVKHPPENLRQDLPCLQDFDYVYRGLKEVSDKLIQLQPQKCKSFLEFCKQGQNEGGAQPAAPNAFLNYVGQMLQK